MDLRRKVEGEKDGGKEDGRKERRERKKAGRQEDRMEGFKKVEHNTGSVDLPKFIFNFLEL